MRLRGGPGALGALAMAGLLALAGCSSVYRGHGYAPPPEELSDIVPGQDSQGTVREKIGRPGSTGVINESAWYYVGTTIEHYAYREPKVVDRRVVAVLFDDQGTVTGVKQYGIEDGKVIDLVTRTTPTYGKELTVVQQLLGNLLNFNAGSLLR
ncbi:MAG TPA: outer membrane protein assembly factor BamE [Paracoccaceae bacterium]|nr:outer membrane protein assembly factor BamE [Paracoccaceae bacterium]